MWSAIELVKDTSEIQHPSVRETLKFLEVQRGVELHHDGDVPARTGLGSSSSFTVGLLHAIYGLKGIMVSKLRLALDAIHIEQERLKENVGSQDQTIAAFGGFNRIDFSGENDIRVSPIMLPGERFALLQEHLLLFYTGLSRNASEIARDQIRATPYKKQELKAMYQMVGEAINILAGCNDLIEFGELLHESWQLKRSLTDKISTPYIDEVYDTARKSGAIGGKLLGSGGGGFLLLFVKPRDQAEVKKALGQLLHVPFGFEKSGSQVIFYESED